jgi:hypothetical protein
VRPGPCDLCCLWAIALAVNAAASALTPAQAQTVSPVIARYVHQARGEFSVENPTSDPMPVSLSVRGFTVDSAGTVHFRDVPEGTDVEVAWRSFTLPPMSRTVVPYRVRSRNAPAWVVIEAAFLPPRTGSVQTRIVLPHVIYVRQREPLSSAELSVTLQPRAGGQWSVRVANLGGSLDRLTGASWRAADGSLVEDLTSSAPILPHAVRYLALGSAPTGASMLRIQGDFGAIDVPLPGMLSRAQHD